MSAADRSPWSRGLALLVGCLLLLPAVSARAQEPAIQSEDVAFASARTGASLHGVLFAPDPLPTGSVPAVVVAPGSGGLWESGFRWAAEDLARHGYLAVSVDPQGVGRSDALGDPPCALPGSDDPVHPCPGVPFQQAATYVDAIVSSVDYLTSGDHDWLSVADVDRLGVAGHSLSARAASWLQGEDGRIQAIVAWDNLSRDLHGDEGSASGSRDTSTLVDGDLPGPEVPVTPRVPALGQANGSPGSTTPTNTDPDIKKAGWQAWRDAGVASMELVFDGVTHGDWSSQIPRDTATQRRLFSYYTIAWFDRWLKHDESATDRLLAQQVAGVGVEEFLSPVFRSAAFVDGVDCGDYLQCDVDASSSTDPGAQPGADRGDGGPASDLPATGTSWLPALGGLLAAVAAAARRAATHRTPI